MRASIQAVPGARIRLHVASVCLMVGVTSGGCAPDSVPPDIVLIVIDTLRADRLSSYGYARRVSPRLDALAARGLRFENATSTSGWTIPAHASMFTGLYPIRHGATQEGIQLSDSAPVLAEIMASRGYATLGVSANPLISAQNGFSRGFQKYVSSARPKRHSRHPNLVAVEEMFADQPPQQPFFLFVNFIEPHSPYLPPEPHRSRWLTHPAAREVVEKVARRRASEFYLDPSGTTAQDFALMSDLYAGEVAHVDSLVGQLLDAMEAAGRLKRALVIVTSDHGENLGDHGHLRHVFSLYDSTTRIPLIAVLPDGSRAGDVVVESVSAVDIFASILSAAEIAPPAAVPGRDILSGEFTPKPVFAEYYYPLQALDLFDPETRATHAGALRPYLRRLRTVQHDGWKLIWSSDGRHELYNLMLDPAEQIDLAGVPGNVRQQQLHSLLDAFVERGGGPRPLPEAGAIGGAFGELDDESAARLRELGYLR